MNVVEKPAGSRADEPTPSGEQPEALIEEAREWDRRRRRRFSILVALVAAFVAGCILGITQLVSSSRSAPACSPGGCTALSASDPDKSGSEAIYGLFMGSKGHTVQLGPHAFEQVYSFSLARLAPSTLRPLGAQLPLGGYYSPLALSPDEAGLFGADAPRQGGVKLVDLHHMRIQVEVDARIDRELGGRSIVAGGWPTADRIVALVQGFSSEMRHVTSRTLIGFSATTGRIAWTRPLPHRLPLISAQTIGDKLVLQLSDAQTQATSDTLIVASPDGHLRSSRVSIPSVRIGTQGQTVAVPTLVTIGGVSPAAYLVSGNDTIFSIDLATTKTTPHHVSPPADAPTSSPPRPGNGVVPNAVPLGGNIAATGLFTLADGRQRNGLYLIDPSTWSARLLNPGTPTITSNGTTLATSTTPGATFRPDRGITLYNQAGKPVAHLYDGTTLDDITLTQSHGYAYAPIYTARSQHQIIPSTSGEEQLVFNPSSGKRVTQTPTTARNPPQLIYPGSPALTRR